MASGQPMVAGMVPMNQMGQPVGMGQPVYSQAPYGAYPGYATAYGAGAPGYGGPGFVGGPGYAVVMAQPVYPQQQQQVPTGQPFAQAAQQRVYVGAWSDGVFDCGMEACLACLLAPVRFAFTISRAGLGSCVGSGILYGIFWLAAIVGALLGFLGGTAIGFLIVVGWIGTSTIGYVYRVRLRTKYQIAGDVCTDLLYHWFCQCCALAQEGRHVDRSTGLVV
jgi:Cys-rich protein (TIGR01571 family)